MWYVSRTGWKARPERVTAPYAKTSCKDMSKAGHVKFCLNVGGPPFKPKYSCMTDSELVPRGKGEKHPD